MERLLNIILKIWIRILKEEKLFNHRLLYVTLLVLCAPALLFGQTVVGTIQRPGFIPFSLGIYEGGNKLFVSDWDSNQLLIYDCTTLGLISELDLGASGIGMMVVHESTGKIYLDVYIDGIAKIAVINANTNELLRFIDDVNGTLRIDESLGKAYALDRSYNGNLYVIDIATDTVTTVQLTGGGFYSNIKVNPVTHEVFIGYISVFSEQLDIVDGNTATRTTIDAPNGWDLAVNWLENKVYMVPGPINRYWVYDRDTDSTRDIWGCPNDATWLYFNPTNNRVHTSSEVNCISTIIEGASDSCFNIPMYGATVKLGFRYATNHVYYVGTEHIVVLDGSTLERLADFSNVWLVTTGEDIAINQSTGRVFISYYMNDPDETNTVVVIQDSAVTIEPDISVIPDTLCFGIPANLNSSRSTDPYSVYNNYKSQELPDYKLHRLPEGKKIVDHSLPLPQEQPRSSSLQYITDKGNIDTLRYDDGVTGSFYGWGNGARMASRMSPAGSCKLLAIQIYCRQAQSYRVGVYEWAGSHPGNQIIETGVVYSFGQGWNTTDISSYEINVNGDFMASFNMIDAVACLGFDTSNNGRAWDYDGISWSAWNETYFIRSIVEYEDGIVDTVATMTIKNLGDTDLAVNDITASQQWITSIEPQIFAVAPDGSQTVTVTVSTAGLSNGTYYGSLSIFSNDPDENPCIEPVKFIVSIVGIENELSNFDTPENYYLSQNYPNPFNPDTQIKYEITKDSHVILKIFNVRGQEMMTLVDNELTAGSYTAIWDGRDSHGSEVSAGIYFCTMKASEFTQTRKMVLLR